MNDRLSLTYALYDMQVQRLLKQKASLSDEEILRKVTSIVTNAVDYYPGILSDYRLEQILVAIGKRIFVDNKFNSNKTNQKRKVLHYATVIGDVGGHTRVLRNWIDQDNTSDNYLVVSSKQNTSESKILQQLKKNCKVCFLDGASYLERIENFRRLIQHEGIDLVILHHHPFDVVPIVTLAHEKMPPTIIYNHADNIFWLGVAVADLVVDFERARSKYSEKKRLARKSSLLPFPLEKQSPFFSKSKQREEFGIKENELVLFSMGSVFKYKPYGQFDFFAIWTKLLSELPNVVMFVAGVTREDFIRFTGMLEIPKNLRLLGNCVFPEKYLAAADYYIESFPIGGGLASLDCMKYGVAPIYGYSKIPIIYGEGGRMIFGARFNFPYLSNIEKYREFIISEIKSRYYHTNFLKIYKNVLKESVAPLWSMKVDELYSSIIGKKHEVVIPNKIIFDQNNFAKNSNSFCTRERLGEMFCRSLRNLSLFSLESYRMFYRLAKLSPKKNSLIAFSLECGSFALMGAKEKGRDWLKKIKNKSLQVVNSIFWGGKPFVKKMLQKILLPPLHCIENYKFKVFKKKLKQNCSNDKFTLIFDHGLGGGANKFLDNLFVNNKNFFLIRYHPTFDDYSLVLRNNNLQQNTRFSMLNAITDLWDHVAINKIIINDLVSYPNILSLLQLLSAAKSKYKFSVTFFVNDYLSVCPNFTLVGTDGKYCELPGIFVCEHCAKNVSLSPLKSDHNILFSKDFTDIATWRNQWGYFLGTVVDEIICFSESSKNILIKTYPYLSPKIKIIPHEVSNFAPITIPATNNITIGVLGDIYSEAKGAAIILKIAKLIDKKQLKNLKIVIIGSIGKRYRYKNIHITGKYDHDALQSLIKKYAISIVLIPSLASETFSYTAEEAMMMELPLAVFNVGAPGERVSKYKKGLILSDTDPETIVKEIVNFVVSLNGNSQKARNPEINL